MAWINEKIFYILLILTEFNLISKNNIGQFWLYQFIQNFFFYILPKNWHSSKKNSRKIFPRNIIPISYFSSIFGKTYYSSGKILLTIRHDRNSPATFTLAHAHFHRKVSEGLFMSFRPWKPTTRSAPQTKTVWLIAAKATRVTFQPLLLQRKWKKWCTSSWLWCASSSSCGFLLFARWCLITTNVWEPRWFRKMCFGRFLRDCVLGVVS